MRSARGTRTTCPARPSPWSPEPTETSCVRTGRSAFLVRPLSLATPNDRDCSAAAGAVCGGSFTASQLRGCGIRKRGGYPGSIRWRGFDGRSGAGDSVPPRRGRVQGPMSARGRGRHDCSGHELDDRLAAGTPLLSSKAETHTGAPVRIEEPMSHETRQSLETMGTAPSCGGMPRSSGSRLGPGGRSPPRGWFWPWPA